MNAIEIHYDALDMVRNMYHRNRMRNHEIKTQSTPFHFQKGTKLPFKKIYAHSIKETSSIKQQMHQHIFII